MLLKMNENIGDAYIRNQFAFSRAKERPPNKMHHKMTEVYSPSIISYQAVFKKLRKAVSM